MSACSLEALVNRLSYNLIMLIGCEVRICRKEVASGNDTEGAFETNKNQDEYDVDADGADEHDKIEDCHEQNKVCYK